MADWIERYIHAVTQRLPQSQRGDIAEELHGLIDDMLEERTDGQEPDNTDIQEVLLELGPPAKLAERYRGTPRWLIGPALYDHWLSVLKIVTISIVFSLSAAFAVQTTLNPLEILDHFVDYIVGFITVPVQGAGWITLTFALIERYGGHHAEKASAAWKPSDLPPIPAKARRIRRTDPLVSIFFLVLLGVAITSQFFGVYMFKNGQFVAVVNFLDPGQTGAYLPLIFVLLGLFILKELLKLTAGVWSMKLAVSVAAINVLALVIIGVIILGQTFWNPYFMEGLVQGGMVEPGTEAYVTVSKVWAAVTRNFVILLILLLIWDSVEGFLRLRKGGMIEK